MRNGRRSGFRIAVTVVALAATCQNAMADNVLRRVGRSGPATPDAAAAQAAAQAAASAARAEAMARQAQSPVRQALEAVKRFQASQDAARAAASAAPGGVPNGLGAGGLELSVTVAPQGAEAPNQVAAGGRTEVTVKQKDAKAILTWTSFNVGKETDLHFDQTAGGADAGSWIALNRVTDPGASPSAILGSIRAEGQVYVLNRNGILFGGSSQVNVGALIASTLDIVGGDARFREGLLFKPGPTFQAFPGGSGAVTVEAGCRIAVAPFGQALLLGGQVVNRGSVEAPDGQVLLAAGDQVSLTRAVDTVDLPGVANRGYASPVVTGSGRVENTGSVSTPRGNITLVGAETVQAGLLTATTSADASGSISLGADGSSTRLEGGSVTQVLPDEGGKKVLGSGSFTASHVNVYGEKISLLGDATIYAPSGEVILSARLASGTKDDTRVYLGEGSRVDVSGLRDVEVAMEQNTIEAQFRANELRDNPVLRDVAGIRGRTFQFDARRGTQVADVAGYYGLVERDVKEVMTAGGHVTLLGNEIITREGSVIDISGGSLRFLDGYVRSTQLIDPTGKRVGIEDAVAGVRYVGIDGDFVANHARWGVAETYSSGVARSRPRFEQGYEQGAPAGKLTLSTNAVPYEDPGGFSGDRSATGAYRILDGSLVSTTVVGPRQREMPTSAGAADPTRAWRERPRAGTVELLRSGDVSIAGGPPQLGAGFAADTALDASVSAPYAHLLPAKWFDGKTVGTLSVVSGYATDANEIDRPNGTVNLAPGGHLTVGAGVVVNLGDGGTFSFTGKRADVDGTILAPGGTATISSLDGGGDATIHMGSTGTIDVAGRWTNDHLDATGRPLLPRNGGTVRLAGVNVLLDEGSRLDVSGGAQLDVTGRKITNGNGGSIVIDVTQPTRPQNVAPREAGSGRLELNGTLAGFAPGKGGALTLDMPYDVVVGGSLPPGAGGTFRLIPPSFFGEGGFSSFTILGERSVTVSRGTVLSPSTETLVLPAGFADMGSGARLAEVATRQIPPGDLRAPMSLTLSTVPVRSLPGGQFTDLGYTRDVRVEGGARIEMAQGSSVRLTSSGAVSVDGTVQALGGSIELSATDSYSTRGTQVRLGTDARILAGGYEKRTPDGSLIRRSVEDGGTVTISAAGASGSVLVEPGAVVDASGIRGTADLAVQAGDSPSGPSRYQAVEVDGSAGKVSISAQSGNVKGDFRLAPGGPSGSGGSLQITSASPIVISAKEGAARPGTMNVPASVINDSRADAVTLDAIPPNSSNVTGATAIQFDGDVTLQARRSLTLISPLLATMGGEVPTKVTLDASYVRLLGGGASALPDLGAGSLRSELTVNADLIDLRNWISLGCPAGTCTGGGFRVASFHATGDIRLSDGNGVYLKGYSSSGLFSHGELRFDSAQVYVSSLQQVSRDNGLARPDGDPGFLVQSDQSITITSNGAPAPVPLAFGERLTLRAPDIQQGGVLRAPQGQIQLEGTGTDGSVRLLPGSLTSASLEGAIVPFGAVSTTGTFVGYDKAGQGPVKSIVLNSPNVNIARGATIDVSGGGDLLGWTFVPGNGGSQDVLSSSGGFAVLPSLGSGPAPLGGVATLQDSRFKVGDVVWLAGMPGLAAGYYTLLPAHYALLPGGLLVQALGGSLASVPAPEERPDGATILGGYRAVFGTPARDEGFARFRVLPHEAFEKYSQFGVYSFDQQARATSSDAGLVARTIGDAGTAVLSATNSLTLEGTGRFGAGEGRLLGNLDISAPHIAMVAGGAEPPDPTYLRLEKQALEDFGAGSVLLGGTRAPTATGTAVTVRATDVVVDIGSASPWKGPEIILASAGKVSVADGSVIQATGAVSNDTNPLEVKGDGALLRLSTGTRVGITRPGATGADGELHVGGASLSAAGSLTLDGSRLVAIAPGAVLSGAQFDLASQRINLGTAPLDAPGTTLGTETVTRLASSADLLLRGYDSIHLYGNLVLGGRAAGGGFTLEKVTLDTGRVQGHADASGSARITAGEFTLRNSGGSPSGDVTGATGVLELDVGKLGLGPGRVQLAGYSGVQGRAGIIEATGDGGLEFGGDLNLATGRLQAASGARYDLRIGGDLALSGLPGTILPLPTSALGATMTMEAGSVLLDTAVLLPAGRFEATATAGTVRVSEGASIDVSGRTVDLEGQTRFARGGTIHLLARDDLAIAPGALLDVSGSERGGSAGAIVLDAGGLATVGRDGSPGAENPLRGSAVSGFEGGTFVLDAGRLTRFSDLNGKLEAAGFDGGRSIRLRSGDVVLEAGEAIHAHDVALRSDEGRVVVAGDILASGSVAHPDGGRIDLVGGNGVVVAGTATVDARAGDTPPGGFDPASGTVSVIATGGRVDVAPGAVIDVGGGRQAGGRVVVRAAREASDVAVDRLAAEVRGAREVVVQGSREYQSATVDAPLAQLILGDAAAWLQASQGAIRSRLGGVSPGVDLQVAPAMAVRSDGDLAVVADIAINGALGNGYLGLFAGGKLDVRATVSDGFASAARSAPLLSGRSSSLELASGGDLRLAAGSMVRTGTGDISIRAGGDLLLAPAADATGFAAVVYTAGHRADPASGWTPPARFLGDFPTGGGDVDLQAGRDVVSPIASQTTSAWLFRQGETNWAGNAARSSVGSVQPAWYVVFKNFEQGVGALGGGDVRVKAGRDVVQLEAAIPTTGHVTTPAGQAPQPGDLEVRGGGDLDLEAGRDVLGGLFVLGRGQAEIHAGGGVLRGPQAVSLRTSVGSTTQGLPRQIGLLFGLMDATATVSASSGAVVEGVFDPARQGQVAENLVGGRGSAFWGYSDRSGLDVTSLSGSVTYVNDPWASVDLTRQPGVKPGYQVTMSGNSVGSLNAIFGRAPPVLRLASLDASVLVVDQYGTNGSTLYLAPAAGGDLQLLARQDVRIGISIEMEATAPEYRRGPLFPFATNGSGLAELGVALDDFSTNRLRGPVPIHSGDTAPSLIYALEGSVCAYRSGACSRALLQPTISLPKPLQIVAGKDVSGGFYSSQNNAPDDISWFRAGRDIDSVKLQVSGVGTAGLEAGRDVILRQAPLGGSIQGIGSGRGQGRNQALPGDKAVDVYVLAGSGAGVAYDAFAAAYLDPANGQGVPRTYLPELGEYLKALGRSPLPGDDVGLAFRSLPQQLQKAFLDRIFFFELKETGIEYNDASSPRYRSYERGYHAVSLLFPSDPGTIPAGKGGRVILEGQPFETWAAGSITVLAPYGRVAIGSELVDTGEKGGIVTRRGGDIRIMADQNIDLFTSRVFTLQGGDVTMWTTNGSITAGAGSRTSVFQRPLAYSMSNDGLVSVDAFGISTGAGIGVLDAFAGQNRQKSRLDLIAPNGEVNAGDAGIRVVGDLNIAALTIVGMENISVSGASAGVPKVEAPNIGAMTSASQVSQAATKEGVGADANAARSRVADLPSIITVEPVGYEVERDEDKKKESE